VSRFIVIVEFTLRDGGLDRFLPHMLANARASLEREEGCHRFDVLTPDGSQDRIVLYEMYRDRAAFDAHGRTQHYLAFAEATRNLVSDKVVTYCTPADPSLP
jgi:quinol monooxygenase YgiN